MSRIKTQYYFRHADDEYCQTLEYHMDDARSNELTEVELIKAIPVKSGEFFWCRAICECGEQGSCGKNCSDYEPKNKVSGMCRHRSNTTYEHGEKVLFKVKP